MSASELVLGELTRLEDTPPATIAAHIFAGVYALAMKSGVTPREVVDNAFKAVVSDSRWRDLEPAIRNSLAQETHG